MTATRTKGLQRPPSLRKLLSFPRSISTTEKIPLLVLTSLIPAHQAQIGEVYELIYAPTAAETWPWPPTRTASARC